MFIAYLYNMASSCIRIFSLVFRHSTCYILLGLFNPFFRIRLECSVHNYYRKLLVPTQEEIQGVKSRELGGHITGSSLPIQRCERRCRAPSGVPAILTKIPRRTWRGLRLSIFSSVPTSSGHEKLQFEESFHMLCTSAVLTKSYKTFSV